LLPINRASNIGFPLISSSGVNAVADQTGVKSVPDKPFLTDIKTLRERARKHIENGAVTEGYSADRESVVKVLNEALATEIVCVLRYKRHYFMASGINAESVAAEFLQHANDEQGHADQIAQRIVQLGGEPNFNPEGLLTRSHAEYVEGDTLTDMIKEDLVAERIAIDSYREIVNYLGNDDPTTRRLMEGILAVEEEHADDLVNLLDKIGR
jgi:bacterioferritin